MFGQQAYLIFWVGRANPLRVTSNPGQVFLDCLREIYMSGHQVSNQRCTHLFLSALNYGRDAQSI